MDENLTIQKSTDYSIFKRLEGNREVIANRIKKIINSINHVGYILSPIIVNEKYEVIDGQGRLEALRELGLPVYFIMQKGIGIEECIAMNINMTNWSMNDYIDSYCERGNRNYILFRELITRYPSANLDVLFTAAFRISGSSNQNIKDGTLTLTTEQYNDAITRLDYAYELYSEIEPKRIEGSLHTLVQAMVYCFDYKALNKKRLKAQVFKFIHLTHAWTNIDNCMSVVEDIYNRNTSNRVYLTTLFKEERDSIKSNAGKTSVQSRTWKKNGDFEKSATLKHPYDIGNFKKEISNIKNGLI